MRRQIKFQQIDWTKSNFPWNRIDPLIRSGIPFSRISSLYGISGSHLANRKLFLGLKREKPEWLLQKRFVATLKCQYAEFVRIDYGEIDVLTSRTIYEIKNNLSSYEANAAVGQLLRYKHSLPEKKMVIVTDCIKGNEKARKDIINFANSLGIRIIELGMA